MNELTKVFKHSELGEVRTLTDENGELWFVASDVCKILGHSNSRQAVKDNCKDYGVRVTYFIDTINRQHLTQVVNEANLYRLILKSRLSAAEKFERWVMEEVLPSIRKTGTYTLTEKQQQQLALAQLIEESRDTITVGEFAKFLNNHKFDTSPNKLFEWLRKEGFLMSSSRHWNEPYQKYIDCGYFKLQENIVQNGTNVKILRQTLITGKGQSFLAKRLANQRIRQLVKFKKLF